MKNFSASLNDPREEGVDTYDDVFNEMDIFQRTESQLCLE